MPGRCELRIQTPKHFVASGAFGMCEPEHAPRAHECHPRALGFVPGLMSTLSHPLLNALPCEICTIVELERHRHLEPKLDDFGPVGLEGP